MTIENPIISQFSGFVVKSLSAQEGGKGCWLGYVTHSNPKGKLPSWVINRLASGYAPRLVKRLHKACLEYPEWKSQHSPNQKNWIHPEQIATTPKIDLNDVSGCCSCCCVVVAVAIVDI